MRTIWIAIGVAASAAVALAGDPTTTDAGVVTVVGPDLRPVVGALVYVHSEKRRPGTSSNGTPTGADGTVRFTGLDPDSPCSVSVHPPPDDEGLAATYVRWLPRAAVVVELPRGRTVRGATVDATGRARRAIVHLKHPKGRTTQQSGENGEFEFRHVLDVPVDVLATPHTGRPVTGDEAPRDAVWTTIKPGAGPIRLSITVVPLPTIVDVTVVGPEGAIPAQVRLDVATDTSWGTRFAKGGRIEISAPPGEEIYVRALAAVDADGSRLDWSPTRASVPAGATRLRIDMGAGRFLAGRIVDDSGAPMVGATVLAIDPETSLADPISEGVSVADGRFRIGGLGDEAVDVTTSASPSHAAAKRVSAVPGREDVLVVARRAVPSRVRIVDPSGAPVVDADVTVMESMDSDGGPREAGTGHRSASDGLVVLPAMDPATPRRLLVQPPPTRDDLAPLELDPWVPVSGDIRLSVGYVASLRVLDEHDRPVAARVWRWIPPRVGALDEGGLEEVGQTDEVGGLRVRELPLGASYVRARRLQPADVFPQATVWTRVDDQKPSATLRSPATGKEMRIRTDRGAIAGLVGTLFADIGGPAFDGMEVFISNLSARVLHPVDPGVAPSEVQIRPAFSRTLQFSDEGTASVAAVASGPYSILVSQGEGAKLVGRVDLPSFDGKDVIVPLVEPKTVRIFLVADGPISALTGEIDVAGRFAASAKRGDGDSLVGEGLPPGRYRVRVSARVGGRRFGALVDVEAGADARATLHENRSPFR